MDRRENTSTRDGPRYILVSDFQTFELHDLDEREVVALSLADLPAHVEAFSFILGVQRRRFRDQDPINIVAAELVGQVHDALDDAGYRGHDLERFLVRMVFCLFAADTGRKRFGLRLSSGQALRVGLKFGRMKDRIQPAGDALALRGDIRFP